jgi:hypothetical protein
MRIAGFATPRPLWCSTGSGVEGRIALPHLAALIGFLEQFLKKCATVFRPELRKKQMTQAA